MLMLCVEPILQHIGKAIFQQDKNSLKVASWRHFNVDFTVNLGIYY